MACGCGFDRNGTFIVKCCGLQRGCLYLWVWHVGVVLIAITRKGDFYCEVLWFAEGVFILVGVACGCGFDSHNQKRGLLL